MYSGFKRRCIKKTSTSSSWMPALIQGNANAFLRPGVSIALEKSTGLAAPSPHLHRTRQPALLELAMQAPSIAAQSLAWQPPDPGPVTPRTGAPKGSRSARATLGLTARFTARPCFGFIIAVLKSDGGG